VYLVRVDEIFKFFVFDEFFGFFAEAQQGLDAFDYVFLFEIHQILLCSNNIQITLNPL